MPGESRLLRPGQLPLPCRPELVFGRTAPLALDIGCGDGRFLFCMARRQPGWDWLGVEAAGAYAWRAASRLARHGVANARLLHGTAGFAVRYLLPPCCVHVAYVNFPDPWPKARHHERRLLREPFLRALATRLVPHGRLMLTTDDREYAELAADEAGRLGLYEVRVCQPPPEALTTKYAAKWQAAGRDIYGLSLELVAAAPEIQSPVMRCRMPHAVLAGQLPDRPGFGKLVRNLPNGRLVVLEAMRSLSDEGFVFLVQVHEPDLEQSVLVEARPHRQGTIVRLRRFGHPVVTPGVRAAVGCVAEWLVAQGLTLRRRSY